MLLDAAGLDARHARWILIAGPAAEAAFGLLVVVAALLAPLPLWMTVLVALNGAAAIGNAAGNLLADREGTSDGAQLRRLRE